jgi:phosphohistidine phosphatase
MLTLTLFRHAKSSWAVTGLDDFDRPLSPRGVTSAPLMAGFLADRELAPDLVLCSTALRARQTLELALPAWRPAPDIDYDAALYHASTATLLTAARKAPDAARHVMIVGHNPGLHAFAGRLIGAGEARERRALTRKFPTAGVACIGFSGEGWAGIEPGTGELIAFATPRRLAKTSAT